MNGPLLIGLTGLAGSGKSTCADYLIERGAFMRVKLAEPLKKMLRNLLRFQGVGEQEIAAMIEGELKECPTPFLNGITPRYAMQTLGTEWGRGCVHPTFWTDIAARQIERYMQDGWDVVVDDVRFPNEAEMIRRLGGRVARVIGRRSDLPGIGHNSENALPVSLVNNTINNRGPFEDAQQDIDSIVRVMRGAV